jgi:cardiolipin synthase
MANLLTIGRIVLIIPFAAMFFISAPWAMNVALLIFAIASVTDLLDGWVARARNEVSALGAALDPIADKLLIAAALLLLVRNGTIREAGVAAALIILLREIFVGGLREALAARGKTMPVTGLAKWKTAAQMIAIGLLLAAAPDGVFGQAWQAGADGALWLAAVLTLWTGADYARRGIRALREDA